MTLVTFIEPELLRLPAPSSSSGRRGSSKVEEAEVGGVFGQQTGWIQVGDLAIAFVFPVRVVQTEEPESEQAAA
jgi:hypothetical protein